MGCHICARGWIIECGCSPELDPYAAMTKSMKAVSTTSDGELRGRGRPELAVEDVKDPRSTMRKRAQKVFSEANPSMVKDVSPCQWMGYKNVGLQRHTIIGCISGVFKHVHHLNKDIFDNRPENLAGICSRCHNLQHSFIDPCVKRDGKNSSTLLFGEAVKASEEELELWNNPAKKHLIPRANHSECELVESRSPEDPLPDH